LLVFCVFHLKSMTMAAAGAIRHRHLTDGGIQWLGNGGQAISRKYE